MTFVVRPKGDLQHTKPLGPERDWALHFMDMGAGMSAMAAFALTPSVLAGATLFVSSLTLIGMVGYWMPFVLLRYVRRIPLLILAAASAGIGANLGAAIALLASLLSSKVPSAQVLLTGAVAGLLFMGIFSVPYVMQRALKRSTRVLRAMALASTPIILFLASHYTMGS